MRREWRDRAVIYSTLGYFYTGLSSTLLVQFLAITVHSLYSITPFYIKHLLLYHFFKNHASLSYLWHLLLFSWRLFCWFTSRSSASEEDDKEDSAWEPQKKVPRSRKQPPPKESKPKRMPRVKKNTPQISDGSEVVVKEELVGAIAGWRELCGVFLIGDVTFLFYRVGQGM